MKVANNSGCILNMLKSDYERLTNRGINLRVIEDEKEPEKPNVDIIIIRYGQKEIEDKAINCVNNNTTHPYTLTIYDNYKKKEGLSKVWNRLIKKSKSDFICLLNSDAFVTEGWLDEMMKPFEDNSVVAICPSGDNVGSIQKTVGTKELSDKLKGKYEEIGYPSGFCLLIRKTDVKFPEEIPFYGGESAWSVLQRQAGKKLIWAKGAFVNHLGGASGKSEGMYHELRASGITQYSEWLAKNTPVLFTTYNRIEFTKKTLPILLKSTCGQIIVIDNNSTDGTQEWLKEQEGIKLILNEENVFVAGAMNQFFDLTENNEYVAKVDNDTIVKKDWLVKLLENSLLNDVDIVQAKHPLISDTHPKGFDDWVKNFPQKGTIRLNEFVGGSGVVIKRKVIKEKLNTTLGVLSSWTHWQHQHKEVYKGFDTSVEIKLLDTEYGSKANYNKYKDYYIFTGREKKKKLDIGSGNWKFEGYETLDNDPIVEPNILADIEDKIPAKDETYDEIRCHHILEHIETKNKVKVMGELWRILKTGGILDIEVPNFPSPQSIQDPTHVSFWNSESFRYFLKSDSLYENFHKRYSQYTVPTFERLSEELESGWIYRTKLKKI